MNVKVFVSYSHLDIDFARRLTSDLEDRGVTVWLDAKDIRVGDSISASVEEGLASADFACLILSSHSVQSRWVDREYRAALSQQLARADQKPTLMPIVIEDVLLPVLLRDIRYADFRRDFRSAFEELCRSIRIPLTTAPFMGAFAGYDDRSRDMLPQRFIEFIGRQEIEALSNLWTALVDGTKQLHSELVGANSTHRVVVEPDDVNMFLNSQDKRTGIVPVGAVSLEEVFDPALATGRIEYGLAMNGVWMLLWHLARHSSACVARRIYIVPSTVMWTRQWEGREPGVVDFRELIRSSSSWQMTRHEA